MRAGADQATAFRLPDEILQIHNPDILSDEAERAVRAFFADLPPDGRRFFEIPENPRAQAEPVRIMAMLLLLVHWRLVWRDEFKQAGRPNTSLRRQLRVVREAIERLIQSRNGKAELGLFETLGNRRVSAVWYSAAGEASLNTVLIACHVERREALRDLALRLTLSGGTPTPAGVVGGRSPWLLAPDRPHLNRDHNYALERVARWAYAKSIDCERERLFREGAVDRLAELKYPLSWHTPNQPPERVQKAVLCGIVYLFCRALNARGSKHAIDDARDCRTALRIARRHARFRVGIERRARSLVAVVYDTAQNGKEVVKCGQDTLAEVLGLDWLLKLRAFVEREGAEKDPLFMEFGLQSGPST